MAKSFDELVMRTTTKAVRDRAARRSRELLSEMLLAELRKAHKVSQNQLAKAMGIRQPSLSKLEKQSDMQVSTLDKLIKALGGTLLISAKFDNEVVTLRNFAPGALTVRSGQPRPKPRAARPKHGRIASRAGRKVATAGRLQSA